jgi:hypothetical protein
LKRIAASCRTGPLLALFAASLIIGCDLFDDLEKEGANGDDPEVFPLCEEYCEAIVHAWDDCLTLWYACTIANKLEAEEACTSTCNDIANALEDEEREIVKGCLECLLNVYGSAPTCWDVYLTDGTLCEEECPEIDLGDYNDDWTDVVVQECPGDTL